MVADPVSYRPRTGEIPTDPGVYRFRDEHSRVIYVGKAKNLRSRLNSYFAAPRTLPSKTRAMVFAAAGVEWTVVGSELEALQLEYTWIKEFTPRFNIRFRDDKSYPYLAVTMGEKYPRVQVMRGDRIKGTRYFGPYSQAWAIRETVDTLLRVFPVRTCSAGVFKRARLTGRPCLLGYIDKCSAPCVERISEEDHRALAAEFCAFMSGEAKRFITAMERQMSDAVAELDYEAAARLRDDIAALRKVFERSAVVLSEDTDADVFALSEDELEAAVQVFHVRGGRIRGQRGWVVEKVEDMTTADLLEHLIQQVYGEAGNQADRIPREVLVPDSPANSERLGEWLRGLKGSRVDIRVPQRGDKAALLRTVEENAVQSLKLHKTRRAGDITARSAALHELQEALGLASAPMRIECFDISHVQGTNVVGSMVVVEDGLPKKADYRRFTITGDAARDDTAALRDVISRRFRNYQAERGVPENAVPEPARARFAYPPNLVVVDGGRPQVNAAAQALRELGIDDVVTVGLAKRLEEVWLPDSDFPIILPRASQGMFLLQRLRDEAHRFAITFHRLRRGKSMTASVLDEIGGLGPARRQALLNHFGSVRRLREATVEDLQSVPGIGPALATVLHASLAAPVAGGVEGYGGGAAGPALNTATGEITDS